MEIWTDIEGYEGLYQVSSYGKVKSLDVVRSFVRKNGTLVNRTKKGRILRAQVCKGNEYFSVMLYKSKCEKRVYVHRLVAEAFLVNSDSKAEVNHKDGNKLNNDWMNLQWVTKSENMIHALETGLSSAKGDTHYRAIKVIDTETGKVYGNIKECAKELGLSNSYMKNMLCGRQRNKTSIKYLD